MGGKKDGDGDEAYGKPVKYDPSFRGPIKNRGCTDIICCLLFFVFILGYIVVGIVAWVYGDPQQVLYPRNSTGAYCGIGMNKDKPYLLYFNIFNCILTTNVVTVSVNGLQCPTPQVCVSSCPKDPWTVQVNQLSLTVGEVFYTANRNFCLPGVPWDMSVRESLNQELCPSFLLPSTPALGRCFPWPNSSLPELPEISNVSISQGISGLLDSLNARDISVKIFEDFAHSWYWILAAVGQMMSTMFYPLVTFVLLLICIAYWAMTALYLATSGQPQYVLWAPNVSTPGCEIVTMNASCDPMQEQPVNSCPGLKCVFQSYLSTGLVQRSIFNLQIYGVLGLFWTLNWVLALGQCVLAGAFASFYWAFHKPRDIPTFPLSAAFIRTIRYHTGSLAFGSLILTIVQIVRVILEYIDHKLREAQNPVTRCIMCCFKCCLWCLEKFIKFLNRNAYIMIAIYGKNFCVSAKNAFMLLMRNIIRVVILDKVTDLLLLFGKLLVVGGVGVLSFFFFTGRIQGLGKNFENPQLNYYWLPIMTSIVGAYVIASGFFSVFGMCVDTLFLCFLEDLERNDGSLDRPYYMSKSLLKILGKKNQAPPKDKKRKK
ncbi:choline transporter-like protein 4 isoform X4 [Equus quagga]|uniref:choline transporter-like protein 4 isoform X4 n=1 Tax=Equus quagga TaxID=89248 RepID=UPI000C9DD2C9|nr:choline transporter-like protein 4 isoform X3 [Equus caballus]XP_046496199.1 choline transporter-like protein 4 isoform X4 [Equus quagga]